MDNKEFSRQLEKRTRAFAVRIIRLSSELPNTPEGRVIKYQLTKAGTSVGLTIAKPIGPEVVQILIIR